MIELIRSRHCIHRHLRTRGSRHHHWKRVYHFCFQDSICTPSQTNLPSSDQPGRRWSTRRSRRSCSHSDLQNSENWYHILPYMVVSSSLWFVRVGDVSRSYFSWTRLRRALATASSGNKLSSLLFKHRYSLGNWVMHHRTIFAILSLHQAKHSYCRIVAFCCSSHYISFIFYACSSTRVSISS